MRATKKYWKVVREKLWIFSLAYLVYTSLETNSLDYIGPRIFFLLFLFVNSKQVLRKRDFGKHFKIKTQYFIDNSILPKIRQLFQFLSLQKPPNKILENISDVVYSLQGSWPNTWKLTSSLVFSLRAHDLKRSFNKRLL